MNAILEKYLDEVDKHLKPLPTSERVDIVKEIKSSILEMEHEHLQTEQILKRLGSPKDLAKAYLGDLPSKESGFSLNRILVVCAFYSVVGFSGLFVIPTLAIIAPCFMIFGFLTPILGAVKMFDYILQLGIPYLDHISIVLGGVTVLNPIIEFVVSLFTGIILFLAGYGSWKLLLSYCHKVSRTKRDLAI